MVEPLGNLLSQSFTSLRKHIVAVAIAAIVVGVLMAALQWFLLQGVTQTAQGALGGLGLDAQRIQELQQRVQSGDQQALQDLQNEMQKAQGQAASAGPDVAGGLVKTGPMIIVFSLLIMLLSFLYSWFILILAIEERSMQATIARVGKLFLPLLGLSILLGIASCLWIPLLGIIIAIILMPRFLLSPILLVRDGKGIIESIKLSYKLSTGYWGKIVGNLIVAGVCSFIVLWVVNFAVGMGLGKYALPVAQILGQFVTAYITFFAVKLGMTVLSSPLVSSAPQATQPA
jgi:hypothetical protein